METIYTTPHKIWRLALHQRLLALEIRDEHARRAYLTAIDLQADEVLWEEGALEEPWWISLSQVAQGRIFVQVFEEDGQQPTPKALLCLDALQGDGLWELPNFALVEVGNQCLRAQGPDGETVLSAKAGKAVEQWQPLPLTYQTPERYFEQDAHFQTVASFLGKKQIKPLFAVDYWEGEGHIAIGYYKQEGIYLDAYLLLMNANGEEIAHECINKGAKGIGSEGFLVAESRLLFVKDKTSLCAISLQ